MSVVKFKEKTSTPASDGKMHDILARQKKDLLEKGNPPARLRKDALNRLLKMVLKYQDEIVAHVSADYGHRSPVETRLAEVFVVCDATRHAIANLDKWMKSKRRSVAPTFLPASAEVHYQPKGVVGIISPWNYPVQLALVPLANVLAAGNRAMIKPSEFTPKTSELLARIIAEFFDETEVTVITGGTEVGQEFAGLAFDHLLFTGATSIAPHILRRAADNLVPVTLELGGKTPCIVDSEIDLSRVVPNVIAGKMFNGGQSCIAPDYMLLPHHRIDEFVQAFRVELAKQFPSLAQNPDYTAIINDRHYGRLQFYLQDAKEKGAELIEINPASENLSAEQRKLVPHLVKNISADMKLAQDEIFGPILPLVGYSSLEEAITYVNARPRPLALYLFSDDTDARRAVTNRTTAGGMTFNDTMLHYAQDNLPFGGIGPSGMGSYHGEAGFKTFSHEKSILTQARLNGTGLLRPPYGWLVKTALGVLIGK